MNTRLAHIAVWILIMAGLAGCSNMRTVSIDAMRPAEVTFPSNVNTLLIVDRTIYKGEALNLVEGLLTGELPGEDRSGVQALVEGFRKELSYSPRFETAVAEEMLPGNSLTSAFPDPLPWKTVQDITRRYSADGLVAIEVFDSDFTVSRGKREVQKATSEEDGDGTVTEYFAKGDGEVLIGIRVYDPRSETIVDQKMFRRNNSWEASGSSIQDAIRELTSQGEAMRALSRQVGVDYAFRISPMPTSVKRSFYGESDDTPAVEQGSRYADVGNWQGAIDAWKFGIDSAPREDAGKLAYNIAIAYEVLGEFENARQWAERAYVEFGNDRAGGYVSDLNRRLSAEELAQRQLQ